MFVDVVIPGFETRDVAEIFEKVGKLSGTISLHSQVYDSATGNNLFWAGQKVTGERLMRHSLSFGFYPAESENQVYFGMKFTHLEDIFAIEAVFDEMTRLIPLIESGELAPESGYVDIHKKGIVFSFKMELHTSLVLGHMQDEDGEIISTDREICTPNTSKFSIYAMAPTGDIQVGTYHLYSGMNTAIHIAHDFAVMRALIDGKPEADILAMKPIRAPRPLIPDSIRMMLEDQVKAVKALLADQPRIGSRMRKRIKANVQEVEQLLGSQPEPEPAPAKAMDKKPVLH